MRRTPNWDNYIMRKYGQSIRARIAESFAVYAKAVIIVKQEEALDRMMEKIPDHKWRAA